MIEICFGMLIFVALLVVIDRIAASRPPIERRIDIEYEDEE